MQSESTGNIHLDTWLRRWEAEGSLTDALLHSLSDRSLAEVFHPNIRTIGRLVWHILETPKEMLGRTGLLVAGPEYDSTPVKTVQELIDTHRQVVTSVSRELSAKWDDSTLHESDDMYGEQWTRKRTLESLVAHLIHHRGQLTVLMRLAGLPVPGIYGPSKEEWSRFGMQAPKV